MKSINYVIREREAGNEIDSFSILEEAEKVLEDFENEDKDNGEYVDNFYEIVEK